MWDGFIIIAALKWILPNVCSHVGAGIGIMWEGLVKFEALGRVLLCVSSKVIAVDDSLIIAGTGPMVSEGHKIVLVIYIHEYMMWYIWSQCLSSNIVFLHSRNIQCHIYWYGFLLELGLRVVVLLMVILQWFPQWLHWYGLSQGWVLLSITRWLVRDKALSHWLYIYMVYQMCEVMLYPWMFCITQCHVLYNRALLHCSIHILIGVDDYSMHLKED